MALLPAAPPAHGASTASILDVHPAARATLGREEPFYVRIAYTSDEPISLWARPYRNGEQVEQARSNASARYSGSGEALGWFALIGAGEVHEVRILAGGGQPYREWELARAPVQLRWTDGPIPARAQDAWVEELKTAEAARMRAEFERRAQEPVPAGEIALFSGFMLFVVALLLAGLVIPAWTVWRWQGGWRIAAAVPLVLMGLVVLRILIDTMIDPTSHNLWPFEILQFGLIALAIVGGLKLLRRFRGVDS